MISKCFLLRKNVLQNTPFSENVLQYKHLSTNRILCDAVDSVHFFMFLLRARVKARLSSRKI